MRFIDGQAVIAATPYAALVAALGKGLAGTVYAPIRSAYDPTGKGDTLLSMPAWREGKGLLGVKLVTVYPRNVDAGKPSIAGVYIVFDVENGEPRAVIDGTVLTARRTAAASALAATWLARPDSTRLAVIGTGALGPEHVRAHASVHAFEAITLIGRDLAKTAAMAAKLSAEGLPVVPSVDIAAGVRDADIIVACTTAKEPVIQRAMVKPGAHLSLVGAYVKTMAEVDRDTVLAARLFADLTEDVIVKGGEVAQAINAGAIGAEAIEQDLGSLARHGLKRARRADDITLFKSVGFASLDLIAAEMVMASTEE